MPATVWVEEPRQFALIRLAVVSPDWVRRGCAGAKSDGQCMNECGTGSVTAFEASARLGKAVEANVGAR